MVRIASAIALLAITSQTAAFVPATQRPIAHQLLATANDDTDFDAPVLKNPVMASSPMELDHEILIVDDECYLGKYGQHPECVDFDPMHNVDAQTHAAFEMPDFSKLGEELALAIKKSPIGKLLNMK